jgi:hypothetical protein
VPALRLLYGQVRVMREEIFEFRGKVRRQRNQMRDLNTQLDSPEKQVASVNQQLSEEWARGATELYETTSTSSAIKPNYRKRRPRPSGTLLAKNDGIRGTVGPLPPARITARNIEPPVVLSVVAR